MARQPQRELLDLADGRLFGEGIDGVLLRVGRHNVGVVAFEVAAGKVAVRLRSGKDLGPMPVDEVLARIREEIDQKT